LDSHTEAWSFTGDASLASGSVAVAEKKVFLFNYNKITALKANTGSVVWEQQTISLPRHSPAIANGILHYSDSQMVRGIRINDGVEVWSASIRGNGDPNSPGNELAIAKGMVVVPNKGHIYAFITAQ